LVIINLIIFVNFLHRTSYKLVVFCGRTVRIVRVVHTTAGGVLMKMMIVRDMSENEYVACVIIFVMTVN